IQRRKTEESTRRADARRLCQAPSRGSATVIPDSKQPRYWKRGDVGATPLPGKALSLPATSSRRQRNSWPAETPDVPCYVADVRARLAGQLDRLTLELFAVLRTLCHDTPPGPDWTLSEVSALSG